MSYKLNQKISDLEPYKPISGHYDIRLDANESYILPTDDLREKIALEIADLPFNRYPDPLSKNACAAFADYYGVNKDNVTAANGSDELLMLIAMAFLSKDEKVLVFEPDFSMYKFYSYLSENSVVAMPKRSDLTIDLDAAVTLIKEQDIKAVFLSNPCNPTSLGIDRQHMTNFINSVNCLVVLDEAYMDFWDQSLITEVTKFDNVICLRTLSKAIGLAGIRMGFAVANDELTKALRAIKSPYNCDSLSQKVAEIILSDKEYVDDCIMRIVRSRKHLYYHAMKAFYSRPDVVIYPSCTNFIYIKAPDAKGTFELLGEEGVAIRLMGNYLRITASSRSDNERVIELLKQYL